jgi:hypothetical protein
MPVNAGVSGGPLVARTSSPIVPGFSPGWRWHLGGFRQVAGRSQGQFPRASLDVEPIVTVPAGEPQPPGITSAAAML